ncbi:aminotransferase class I/II-fold pyridoxal phosphate-dependent enzyme [Paraflavitalea pollutisoli]|uniref:aminotransferase class I/II-fold pyridoxal phosphate-dependent enzyme n=1 Tax=Paraflavitalea pollutisoli TaxID=3034143 RepID=UPI0023EDC4F7|nr:aminotransferase class I/II-fold pyridoxal phosphate-dependent enzyme [Paraflavitalea sp. H1-2-19X]
MKHSSKELDGWSSLTTGRPAILGEVRIARQVGKEIAALQGLEKGLVSPSTLHLYYDLFDWLCHQPVRVYIDEKVYPVSRYGIEKLLLRKIPVSYFRHMDAQHLARQMASQTVSGARPVIITDGWCPACGRPAPVQQYAALVKPHKGWVVVDDTQAVGVLGKGKQAGMPLGLGGGGLLQWLPAPADQVMTIVSLAKGLGVPMAVISGNRRTIEDFAANSRTRINSSPVSMAHLQAALNALRINRQEGEDRRASLSRNIRLLRSSLHNAGIAVQGSLFPVQTIEAGNRQQTVALWEALSREKIKTVMVTPHWQQDPALSVILRSDQSARDMHKLANAIIRHHTYNKPIEHGNLLTGDFGRTGNSRSSARRQAGS